MCAIKERLEKDDIQRQETRRAQFPMCGPHTASEKASSVEEGRHREGRGSDKGPRGGNLPAASVYGLSSYAARQRDFCEGREEHAREIKTKSRRFVRRHNY